MIYLIKSRLSLSLFNLNLKSSGAAEKLTVSSNYFKAVQKTRIMQFVYSCVASEKQKEKNRQFTKGPSCCPIGRTFARVIDIVLRCRVHD